MAQTREGGDRQAAAAAGVTLAEYLDRRALGIKWCYRCQEWKPHADFGGDSTRGDGLCPGCRQCRSRQARAKYQPKQGIRKHGPNPAPARDGDRKQARARVNCLIRTGKLPPPRQVPCSDCGHVWQRGERRHEYDHHLGYGPQHHLDVQAVCSTCHGRRASERGEFGTRSRHTNGRFRKET